MFFSVKFISTTNKNINSFTRKELEKEYYDLLKLEEIMLDSGARKSASNMTMIILYFFTGLFLLYRIYFKKILLVNSENFYPALALIISMVPLFLAWLIDYL